MNIINQRRRQILIRAKQVGNSVVLFNWLNKGWKKKLIGWYLNDEDSFFFFLLKINDQLKIILYWLKFEKLMNLIL